MDNIFNLVIFNDFNEVTKRMTDPSYVASAKSCLVIQNCENITPFDYILAHRLVMPEFSGDTGCYFASMGCTQVSASTLNNFIQKFVGKSLLNAIHSIKVHQDLFQTMEGSVDINNCYLAFCIDPEPYKICCMQWDAFCEIFKNHSGRTEVGGRDFSQTLVTNATAIMQTNSLLNTVLEDYNISIYANRACCNLNWIPIRWNDCRPESMHSYKPFTSSIGGIDLIQLNVVDDEPCDLPSYVKPCSIKNYGNSSDFCTLDPAIYAYLKTSESFFFDAIFA